MYKEENFFLGRENAFIPFDVRFQFNSFRRDALD